MTTYSRTEVLQFKNGESIVHFPDLTDEERTQRHQQLKAAASRFLKAAERLNMEKTKQPVS